MKLSPEAVDSILHVIATFDRERGVPHDYHDLEVVLRNTDFQQDPSGCLVVDEKNLPKPMRVDTELDDAIEGKEMLLRAAREWLE
jgi:hypothetical protein